MPSTVLDYTLSNTPPVGITPVVGGTAPSNTPPAGLDLTVAPTDDAAAPIDLVGAQSSLHSMPSTFMPAFVELTGGGISLATLTANAADATAGRILQGTVNGELRSYQVRVGTDAQAAPGIIRPANFDAENNPVVFVSL